MTSRLRTFAVAVLITTGLLVATRQIGGGYAPYGAYRAQVDAFLAGRLAVSEAPDALIHDLAWTEHGVQQVWGLGVPAWQAPFELVGRVIGITPFPDRVAMGVWLALMIFVLLRGFARRDHEPWFVGPGTVLIAGFMPAFVTMLRGRIGVYEEAALYSYAASAMLLGGLARFLRAPTPRGYVALAAAAGLGGLIRPTVWFYGLATLIVATVVWLRHTADTGPRRGWFARSARPLALGVALFVAGGGLLYATNAMRFGKGSEFGHRLNLHSLPGNIVATRFSYPFERESVLDASAELFGSLFGRPESQSRRGSFYQTGLHEGQQGTPRWREYYFTTYSWGYIPLLVAGLALAALSSRRRGGHDRSASWLAAWAVLAMTPLLVFYAWSPSLSSRYQLDLAPAFAALIAIAWRELARHARAAVAVPVLVLAWGAAVATSTTARGTAPATFDRAAAANAAYAISRPLVTERELPTGYDVDDTAFGAQSDVITQFAHCFDQFDTPVACDAPSLPGDLEVDGTRDDLGWHVVSVRVPDSEPEVCAAAEPRCAPEPTIAGDPLAAVESVRTTPPPYYLNGFGWDLATGRVPPATYFYVVDPQYVEVEVDYAPVVRQRMYIVPTAAELDWASSVRVAIGLHHLAPVAITCTPRGMRIRFAAPPLHGLQVAFVAFGPDHDLDQRQSDFLLRAIRWRD